MTYRILRKGDMRTKLGFGPSQLDNMEAAGLLTPRVHLGARTVGWVEHEVDRVIHARVRGASDEEVKALVRRIVKQRAEEPAHERR